MPPDWNLAIDELENEIEKGNRGKMTMAEWTQAKLDEKNILRSMYRFPKRGDLYQAKFEQTANYQVDLSGVPASFAGSIIIKAGEQLWVYTDPFEDEPFGAHLLPVHYKEIESIIVPDHERKGSMYNGFDFYITTKILNENFELIQTDFKKEKYL